MNSDTQVEIHKEKNKGGDIASMKAKVAQKMSTGEEKQKEEVIAEQNGQQEAVIMNGNEKVENGTEEGVDEEEDHSPQRRSLRQQAKKEEEEQKAKEVEEEDEKDGKRRSPRIAESLRVKEKTPVREASDNTEEESSTDRDEDVEVDVVELGEEEEESQFKVLKMKASPPPSPQCQPQSQPQSQPGPSGPPPTPLAPDVSDESFQRYLSKRIVGRRAMRNSAALRTPRKRRASDDYDIDSVGSDKRRRTPSIQSPGWRFFASTPFSSLWGRQPADPGDSMVVNYDDATIRDIDLETEKELPQVETPKSKWNCSLM